MSNKTEATYHGRRRSFAVGDWVYVTQLPEFDHRLGRVVAIQDSMKPYVVQIDTSDEYGDSAVNEVFDWLALTPSGIRGHVAYGTPEERRNIMLQTPLWTETTGEHIFHKLGDDLYQDWADNHAPGHTGPRRGWTPTTGELGLALGIMAFIVVLFVFFVFFYRGW